MAFTNTLTPINAVSSTTTSALLDVSLREKISFQFIASGISSGNGVFTVDGSNDGTNWVTGIAFADATATASSTYVTSKTVSSNSSVAGYLPFSNFRYIRYKVTFTTDGVYSVVHYEYGN